MLPTRSHFAAGDFYQELSSDHFPVLAALRGNHNRANWKRFQQVIDSYINYETPLGTAEGIDLQLRSIEQAVLVAREQLVPTSRQVSNTLTIDTLHQRFNPFTKCH